MSAVSPATAKPDHRQVFLSALEHAALNGTLTKLVVAKYSGEETDLQRVIIKPVTVREQACLSFVYRYTTRDITKNLAVVDALELLVGWLPGSFKNAHLLTIDEELQLAFGKKGKCTLSRHAGHGQEVPSASHDREKHRYLELTRPFLADLGVTTARHELIPAMSRKWKQINKFIEVFANALNNAQLSAERPLQAVDFGSGKGYLTFALHDYLTHTLNREAKVLGVELREDMVTLCNSVADRLEQSGLSFQHGDVRHFAPIAIDVMIALHACDIATDYAIHMGIRSDASIIMCSPCCHKEMRLQIQSPGLLKPMLQYGVHMGQQAEMVTDSLRALLLEACGYETKVFEFISLEHTNKNKMILAVKRAQPLDNSELLERIVQLKAFYGIEHQCLEGLLKSDGLIA